LLFFLLLMLNVACCFSMHASVFFVSLNYIKLGDHFVF
jgi:hypothetical protein